MKRVTTGEATMQNHWYGRKDEGVVNKTRFYHINGHLGGETHTTEICADTLKRWNSIISEKKQKQPFMVTVWLCSTQYHSIHQQEI
jgi:hypothetical protein